MPNWVSDRGRINIEASYGNKYIENLLDPLCLHALGGIAIHMLLSGNQSEALGLSKYVILHQKTPEIYKELTWKWFNQKKVLRKENDEDQDKLWT